MATFSWCRYGFGRSDVANYVLRSSDLADSRLPRWSGHTVKSFFTLHDPDKRLGFALVADAEFYPNSSIAVDPAIRGNRWLTGGDLDIESFREAHDGTFWFGDEFGPFLIHTDATGRVLEAEYPLPGVKSPQNPYLYIIHRTARQSLIQGWRSRRTEELYPFPKIAETDPDPRVVSHQRIRLALSHHRQAMV